MDLKWLSEFMREFGFPGVLILGLLYFARQIGIFLSPIVTKISDAHFNLINTLKDNTERQTELLDSLSNTASKSTKAIASGSRALDSLAPEDRKEKVKMHTDEIRRVLNDN